LSENLKKMITDCHVKDTVVFAAVPCKNL